MLHPERSRSAGEGYVDGFPPRHVHGICRHERGDDALATRAVERPGTTSARRRHLMLFLSQCAAVLSLTLSGGCSEPFTPEPVEGATTPWYRTPANDTGSLTLSPDSASLVVGSTLQLTATGTGRATGGGQTTPSWTSSDATVASVSATGLVIGHRVGRAQITGTQNGVSGMARIIVASAPSPPAAEPPASSPPPPQEGYSPTSPHWRHIRTMVTDFYYNWTAGRRDTAAARFDMVLAGSLTEWKQRNPTVKHIPYQLHFTIFKPTADGKNAGDYQKMQQWYASQPECRIEDAFLHNAGTSKTLENRKTAHIWTSDRWIHNPADLCWRRYQLSRLTAARDAGHDGVFYDEYGVATLKVGVNSLELGPTEGAYHEALIETLRLERAAMGSGFVIMINTAEYMSEADQRMIDAAGASHLELFNDLSHGGMVDRWAFVEARLAAGSVIEVVGRRNWRSGLHATMTPGNYADATRDGFEAPGMYRQKMGELASYYIMRPANPASFYFDTNNDNWSVSPTAHWLAAQEVDVGDPVEPRTRIVNTTGADGQNVGIFRREYTRSLVLARPSTDWTDGGYGDASGYRLTLPAGERWYLLAHDGSLGPAMTEITLRKGEGAILLKGSAIGR